MGEEIKIESTSNFILCYRLKVQGALEVPYLGYVETHLNMPEVKAFDTYVLLLIVPGSAHTTHIPITLGKLFT